MERAASPLQRCPLCAGTAIGYLHTRSSHDQEWALARCASCGLHFTDPTPTDSQIREFYSGDFHSELRRAGATERVFGERFRRYVDWIEAFVPSGRALDVGCATGLLPKLLRDRGYAAEGLELHPETANWGAAHYGVPIRSGGIELVASEEDSFDLVTLTEVVEHTPNPLEFLQAVHRLLKHRGYALVTFPDICALKSRYYEALAAVTRRSWVWVNCQIPFHIWEFTYSTAHLTFERAGFSIVGFRRTEMGGGLPGKLAMLSWPMKVLSLRPFASRLGSQMEFMIRKET
jgi:SAM-dependent methyltransferase